VDENFIGSVRPVAEQLGHQGVQHSDLERDQCYKMFCDIPSVYGPIKVPGVPDILVQHTKMAGNIPNDHKIELIVIKYIKWC
jgi:hypothetical protein